MWKAQASAQQPAVAPLKAQLGLGPEHRVYSVEATLALEGMETPLRRLRPLLKNVEAAVPEWLLDAAARSSRMQRRLVETQAHAVWVPVAISDGGDGGGSDEHGAVETTASGTLTLCSDLTSGYSHDVRFQARERTKDPKYFRV